MSETDEQKAAEAQADTPAETLRPTTAEEFEKAVVPEEPKHFQTLLAIRDERAQRLIHAGQLEATATAPPETPGPGEWVTREVHEAALKAAEEQAREDWSNERNAQEEAETALFERGVTAAEKQAAALERLADCAEARTR